MLLSGKTVGFAFTGSHCRIEEVVPEVQRLTEEGARVIPIFSSAVNTTQTRFYDLEKFKERISSMTGEEALTSISETEPIGPGRLFDALVVAPASGNTLAKLANAITDTSVLMACKAHLRNERPLVLAISTNDGLAGNGKNIGALLNIRNIFFVPFGQDDPMGKPNSLVAKMSLIKDTVIASLAGMQLQPLLVVARQ